MTLTPDYIASAAKELIIEGGSEGMSMRKVGDMLGTTPMAVYRHFPSREALLTRVAEDLFEDTYERFCVFPIPPDPVEALHRAVDDLVLLALDRPGQFSFMFLEPRPGARDFPDDVDSGRSRIFALMTGPIDDGIAKGLFAPSESWKIGLSLTANVYGLVTLLQAGRFALSNDQFRALCHDSLDMLLTGIFIGGGSD
ncbi:TetR/AcrR family transcriptional regulator [Glycomyces sp. NPDC046736]|uniref:TetR/AcrR family transcriptional regulator n=1 Tax=Glycomyces sp. NPDC046736 TaxID=3155615 RepID=UPI0033DF7CDF